MEKKSTIFEEGSSYVSSGAGIIYKLDKKSGDAYIITNYHVVYDEEFDTANNICDDISVFLYGAQLEKHAIPATYIGGSPNYDIAVLKIEDSELLKSAIYSEVEVAEFNSVYAGDAAIAIGNPGGTGIAATSGIVSADSEYITLDISGSVELRVMRIDTPVNPGNSGGGLFNKNGQLIGIVNAKTVETNVESVGYAIPISIACSVADNIIYYCEGTSKESVQRPMFGIEIKINDSKAVYTEDGKIAVEEEIVVNSVTKGSIADGKMKAGDIIKSVTIGDKTYKVTRLFNTIDAMLNARVGETVITTVERGGTLIDISITITAACITES
jgi:serine protease Do